MMQFLRDLIAAFDALNLGRVSACKHIALSPGDQPDQSALDAAKQRFHFSTCNE